MAMLIASLCAEGRSTIGNIGQIDRGYERIDERLRALGASIERVDGMSDKRAVRTESAPAPFQGAPYSQGIVAGDLVFVSGQLGIDPAEGHVVEGGIVEQTEQVMKNLSADPRGGGRRASTTSS